MDFVEKARIMDGPRINRALARLSSEIVEENHGAGDLFLVGIRRRGVPLAERMAQKIADLEGYRPPVGVLDITLYRDDLSTVGAKPVVNRTDLPGDIENRNIVLIDDVLYTGRTIRAALDQLIECGANRATGVEHVVDQNDVAVFDVAGKICAIDDWFGSNGREVVAIEGDVEYADRRSIAFEIGDLLRHAFGEWDAATSDSDKKQVACAVILFDDFGRQARQCPIDARAIHDAGFLYKFHLCGDTTIATKRHKSRKVYF